MAMTGRASFNEIIYIYIYIYIRFLYQIFIFIYIFIYGIHHGRILWSSYRKLARVGFEPTTTEFLSDALTDWAIRPWIQLPVRANFVQLLQFHLFHVSFRSLFPSVVTFALSEVCHSGVATGGGRGQGGFLFFYTNKCFNWHLCRSSRPEVFCKRSVLKNFTNFTGENLRASVSFLITLKALGLQLF